MKPLIYIGIVIAVICAAVSGYGAAPSPKTAYEYKVVNNLPSVAPAEIEKTLNSVGQEGWKLITVVRREGTTEFYFERPR